MILNLRRFQQKNRLNSVQLKDKSNSSTSEKCEVTFPSHFFRSFS